MDFVVLDLEWNGFLSEKRKKYINEIIEIGAVKLSPDLKEISRFHEYIKPQLSKEINEYVSKLTSISNEDLINAKLFTQVAARFKRWAGENSVVMTWSKTDLLVLLENYIYYMPKEKTIPFLKRYADLQSYVQEMLKFPKTNQIGLMTAAEMLEIDPVDLTPHRALDDSIIAAACFAKLYHEEKFSGFITEADNNDFYGRLLYKNKIINDIHSKHIKKGDLDFLCPQCHLHVNRLCNWSFKNRAFFAVFKCSGCNQKYSGRVQVKQHYDNIETSKKIVLLKEEQKEERIHI